MYRIAVTQYLARKVMIGLVVLCLVASTSLAFAAESAKDQPFTIISTEHLKSLVDAKKAMMLIDARTKDEYQEAHIQGAINMPEKTFDENIGMLPAEKHALLVLYCNGVKCGKSKKAAAKAAAKGYTNILVYGEGFPVWEEKGYKIVPGSDYARKVETTKIAAADLKKMIDTNANTVILVDVRDEIEFKEGHIADAINIPSEIFASRSEILPKEKKIIVYCNTGGRSYTAYRKLMKLGYTDIAQALFADWKESGLTVQSE